jgi:osmoprotectant transport system substrate-binding protein
LVALTDDLGAQPVFQPSPIIRGEVLRANPEIAGILNPIFASLTAEAMQTMNARVDVAGEDAEAVAREYLQTNGFIE